MNSAQDIYKSPSYVRKKLQYEENSLFIQKTKQGEVSKKNLNDNYFKWSHHFKKTY